MGSLEDDTPDPMARPISVRPVENGWIVSQNDPSWKDHKYIAVDIRNALVIVEKLMLESLLGRP